jgi:hypothetical protein
LPVEATTVYLPLVMHNHVPGPQATASVGLRVEPWMALPGDWVTVTVVVSSTGELPMRDGVLTVDLPTELESPSAPGAPHEAISNELRWDLGALAPGRSTTATLAARVAAGAEMRVVEIESTYVAQAVVAPPRPAVTAATAATLLVGESTTATITPEGGSAASADESVHLVAPPGAVPQPVSVRVATFPLPEWDAPNPYWLSLFDLRAEDAAARALVGEDGHLRFSQPLTVTLALSGTASWDRAYLLHCEDAACRELRPVGSDFDPETEVLTAPVDTFSGVGAAGSSPFPTDGSHYVFENWPGSDLYSGGLSYGLAIAAPPGAGGLGPSLSLGYGSRSLDGLLGIVQSPSVGVGWSLGGTARITRKIETHRQQGVPYVETMWVYENDFTLMIDGTSYKLKWGHETGAGCRYYTAERSGLRVMRYNGLCGYETGRPPNETGEYWVVTTPSGTRYRFGYLANSEQVVPMAGYSPAECTIHTCAGGYWHRFEGYAGDSANWLVASQWSVDWVKDTHGNAMAYTYLEEKRDFYRGPYDRASHLQRIAYGGTYDENDVQRSPMRYRVDVVLEERDGHDDGPEKIRSYTQWESYRVHSIRVCVGNCSGNHILREVVLRYDEVTMPHPGVEWGQFERPELTVLREVQQYGTGGEGVGPALPPVHLSYTNLEQADGKRDRVDGGLHGDKLRYPRLVRVENGYGGWMAFEYERLVNGHVYSYRIVGQQQGDGMGHTAHTRYTYGGACFAGKKQWRDVKLSPCRREQPQNHALLGHLWAEEVAYGYDGAALVRVRHEFHRDWDEALGREWRTQTYGPGAAVPLLVSTSDWRMDYLDENEERYVIELEASQSCQGAACTRSEFTYDAYGNTLVQYLLGDPTTGADDRTTRWTYAYNTDDWIVAAPATEMVYQGAAEADASARAEAKARSYYAYDDRPHGDAPATGDLTRVDVWELGGPYTATMGYDTYGNVVTQTNALGQVSTVVYDAYYHQFPVQACAAVGTAVEQCSGTEYYGVNGPGLDVEGASFGAVYRSWGPNGAGTAVYAWYDGFGRPWKVLGFGTGLRPASTQPSRLRARGGARHFRSAWHLETPTQRSDYGNWA